MTKFRVNITKLLVVFMSHIYLTFTFKFHIKFRKKSKVMGFNRGSSIIPEQCHFFRRNAVTCSVT